MMRTEHEHLAHIAETFTQFDKDIKVNQFRAATIVSFCRGPKILEMGCADGLVTERLVEKFLHVIALDGSEELLERVRKRVPKAILVKSLFEEYIPPHQFNTIILGHVLEHVLDPVSVLQRVKNWLAEDGIIIVTVPNGRSIHRRLGVELGMIKDLAELTEDDHRIGHRRIYDIDTLKTDITSAGLNVVTIEGVMFKPLSNRQMFQWSDELLAGLYRLAKKLPPEFCGELCVICNMNESVMD